MPVLQVMRSAAAPSSNSTRPSDEVKVLANNLPIASGVVVVNRNRIAVEVKQMLPRTPTIDSPESSWLNGARPCPPILDLLHGAVDPAPGANPGPLILQRSWRNW